MESRPESRPFEQLFESSSAIQLLVDAASGALLDVNEAAAEFYGWPRAAMRAMLLADLDGDDARDAWNAHVAALHAGRVRPLESAHVVSTGERRDVALHAATIALRDRAVVHVIVQPNASSAADTHAVELARTRDELETLTRVAGRAAHDLNNVLTVVRGATGFLREALPAGAPQLDDIGALERATDRAEALARQLGAVARRAPSSAAPPMTAPAAAPATPSAQPAATAPSTVASIAAPAPMRERPGMALLVEDESIMREIGRRMLESVGYKVVVVQNASDALAAIERAEPPISLVVTDVVLPGMSGIALIDRIADQRPGVAFVAITGFPIDGAARDSLTTRDVPLLVKPFTRDALAAAVLRVAGMPA